MLIKPAKPKIKVRDPDTGEHLSVKGEEKPDTAFWHRRINDGDVVKVEQTKRGSK